MSSKRCLAIMTNTTTTILQLSPKQSLSEVKKESQKDGDANMLDFGLMEMEGSIKGAKILASGPVDNGV